MIRIRNEQVISLKDWDNLVRDTYGKIYSFQQQDGCKNRGNVYITIPDVAEDYENDTVPEEVNHEEMGVSFEAWLARDPTRQLDTEDEWDKNHGLKLWWYRNFYPNVQMIANDLHAKGLVPSGKYIIEIDW